MEEAKTCFKDVRVLREELRQAKEGKDRTLEERDAARMERDLLDPNCISELGSTAGGLRSVQEMEQAFEDYSVEALIKATEEASSDVDKVAETTKNLQGKQQRMLRFAARTTAAATRQLERRLGAASQRGVDGAHTVGSLLQNMEQLRKAKDFVEARRDEARAQVRSLRERLRGLGHWVSPTPTPAPSRMGSLLLPSGRMGVAQWTCLGATTRCRSPPIRVPQNDGGAPSGLSPRVTHLRLSPPVSLVGICSPDLWRP